ncbi:MAG: mechanosensitive ion channel family protein [Gammaproteobacteria bacterium]
MMIMKDLWFAAEALATLAISGVLLFVWLRVRRKLRRHANKTESPWDNAVINVVDAPLMTAIVAIGLQHAAFSVAQHFPQFSGVREFSADLRAMIIVVTVFWLLMRLIGELERVYRNRILRIGDKDLAPGILYSVFRMLRFAVFVLAALTAMDALGVSVSGILAFGGVGGVVLGFAAKDTLANFFSGLMIFWERPFVVGDWIRCPSINAEGTVERIGWRLTQIRTFDQRPLYIPNSLFSGGIIENPQRMTNRRIYEYFGVRYDDIGKIRAILADIRQVLAKHKDIDQKQICIVNLDRYGASSADCFIYAMTTTTQWRAFHEVKEEILLTVADIIAKHGAEFAFPTRTLHITESTPPPNDKE